MIDFETQQIVDLAGMAHALDVTERRVQQLETEGTITRLEHGKYDLFESVRGYCGFIRDNSRVAEDERRERVRLLRVKRQHAALKLQEFSGELVRADVVRQQDLTIAKLLTSSLEAVPDRYAGPLAAENDSAKVYEFLAAAMYELLNDIRAAMEGEAVPDARAMAEADLEKITESADAV